MTQALQQHSIVDHIFLRLGCMVCREKQRKGKQLWCLHCPEQRAVERRDDLAFLYQLDRLFDWNSCRHRLMCLHSLPTSLKYGGSDKWACAVMNHHPTAERGKLSQGNESYAY